VVGCNQLLLTFVILFPPAPAMMTLVWVVVLLARSCGCENVVKVEIDKRALVAIYYS
jgi:hypothetical protein